MLHSIAKPIDRSRGNSMC